MRERGLQAPEAFVRHSGNRVGRTRDDEPGGRVEDVDNAVDTAAALLASGLVDRTVACARDPRALRALRAEAPALALAWSLKRARHTRPAKLGAGRRDVPAAAAAAVRSRLADGVTVHRGLATPALVAAVHGAGGWVLAWGLPGLREAARLAKLDVDGLIVDDPRREPSYGALA